MSKNASALIRFVAIKAEAGRQRPSQPAQSVQRLLPAAVALDQEGAVGGDADLDLVAFLQLQRLDDGRRQPHREAVAPFRHAHGITIDIRCLRISYRAFVGHPDSVNRTRDRRHIRFTEGGVDMILGLEPEGKVMMLRTIIWVYGVLVLIGFYMGSTPI